jgi:hypothetical protein
MFLKVSRAAIDRIRGSVVAVVILRIQIQRLVCSFIDGNVCGQ